jgi:UDP-glucuronate 4-epimerase
MIDDGLTIPVFGDGTHERDYTYVDDAVQGILEALDLDCGFEVFNLGNAEKVNLRALISQIEKQLGKTATIDWQPEQPGDMPLTLADIEKARKMLGYQPFTAIEDGIRKFVRWFQARKSGHTTVGNTHGR